MGEGAIAVNVADVDVSMDAGEKMAEVAGRKLVGVLDVNVLDVEDVPKARAESAAESVQTAFAVTVTVTVTLPSTPVNVEGEFTDAGAEMAAAVAKGGRMLWPGVDDAAVEVLNTALVGVGSGVDKTETEALILSS